MSAAPVLPLLLCLAVPAQDAASQDAVPPASASDAPAERFATAPITVVLLDDIGWELLAAARTPHLDALAARGVRLTHAWAYPACSPTRAALLTGRHACRTGVGRVVKGQAGERGLADSETTFAALLPERAEAFGKWHVGTGATDPNDKGFAHYAGCLGNLNGPGSRGYYRFRKTVDGAAQRARTYATTDTTDDALASQAPLRYVAYHAAHRPLENPPGAEARTERDVVVAMVEFLDAEIGRLLEGYDGYVFLLSDNGSEARFGGAKGSLEEAGLRVPFFVAGPGIEPAERDDLVSVVDVFATLAEMRGVAIPEGVAEDSISLLPILRGEPGRRETLYAETLDKGAEVPERVIASRTYRLGIDRFGNEVLSRLPEGRIVPQPWRGADAEAAERLRAALP